MKKFITRLYSIKTNWIRRAILVPLFPVLIVIALMVDMFEHTWGYVRDLPKIILDEFWDMWKDTPYRRGFNHETWK